MNILQLRNENLAAWDHNLRDLNQAKLDSNIKKNSAFVKKLRISMNADSKDQLLREIKTLSLTKYLSEAVSATLEGITKCKTQSDIQSSVQVISALHIRFPSTFTPAFTHGILQILYPPSSTSTKNFTQTSITEKEKEEISRVTRQRITLRAATELWLAGVLRTVNDASADSAAVEGASETTTHSSITSSSSTISKISKSSHANIGVENGIVYSALRLLLGSDKLCSNLPIVCSLLKFYGSFLLPIKEEDLNELNLIVPINIRENFDQLFSRYFDHVVSVLLKMHSDIRKTSLIIQKEIGEGSNEKKSAQLNELREQYEKFKTSCQNFAEVLHKDLPVLEEPLVSAPQESTVVSHTMSKLVGVEEQSSIWPDEETKRFYENVFDLSTVIPPALLSPPKSKKENQLDDTKLGEGFNDTNENKDVILKSETDNMNKKLDDSKNGDIDHANEELEISKKSNIDNSNKESDISKSPVISTTEMTGNFQLDSLLSRLPEMRNSEGVNSIAIDFCYLNTKAARRRLTNRLLGVPRTRLDLLPLYSRLIATLQVFFPDIGQTIVTSCEEEFNYLYKKKDLIESRIKNVKYIAELTCFKVMDASSTFVIIKRLLDDFSGHHIEVLCALLDTCGRFLAQSSETSIRMRNMLDVMMRKKAVQHFDNRQILMIENAFYQCIPLRSTRVTKREPTPIEAFVRHLMHQELSRHSIPKIIKTLRRLPWDDPTMCHFLEKVFIKVWKFQYSVLPYVAKVLVGLGRFHPDFMGFVIDSVIEEIRLGLEMNIFKQNQMRVSTAKYLAELFNFRAIDYTVIFDTLFLWITFGHGGLATPNSASPIDSRDDFFRIRLCCIILDTCRPILNTRKHRRRIDEFFACFQVYILSKTRLTLDMEFMVQETFESFRPHMEIRKDYNSAVENMNRLQDVNKNSTEQEIHVDASEKAESDVDEDDGEEDEEDNSDLEDEEEEDDHEEDEAYSDFDPSSETDSDLEKDKAEERTEEGRLRRPVQVIKSEEDEQFEQEFSKMMLENIENRRPSRPGTLDFAIPFIRRQEQTNDREDGNVSFTFLTKKGSKPQTKNIEVPSDTKLAISTRTKQEAEREEQQRLKKIVLNYEERAEINQKRMLQMNAAEHGMNLTFKNDR